MRKNDRARTLINKRRPINLNLHVQHRVVHDTHYIHLSFLLHLLSSKHFITFELQSWTRAKYRYCQENLTAYTHFWFQLLTELGRSGTIRMDALTVELVSFYAKQNAEENHTVEYDLVTITDPPTPVLRRGSNFYFNVRFNRELNEEDDVVNIAFKFGKFRSFKTILNKTCFCLRLLLV